MLILGFFSALISWFYKPAGVVLALIGILPFAITAIGSVFQVVNDPSTVSQAINNIATAGANAFANKIQAYAGALLAGALIGLIVPKGG